MPYTLKAIAAALGAETAGDDTISITGAAEPGTAMPDQIALAMSPKYADSLSAGRARAALIWPGADWQALGLDGVIFAPRARVAMAGLTRLFDPGQGWPDGIHPQAVIDPTAQIGANVSIGPMSVVGPRAHIGDNGQIGPACVIGADAVLGADARLFDHVSIGARVRIGDWFIAHPGARIGPDGFSFVTPEKSGVEDARQTMAGETSAAAQSYLRIHSLGSVEIGDDVEVGANSTIDRGTIRDTRIGNGTKIDNLVQIGHNSQVGNDTLICGMAGLAGSATVGNNVVLGGASNVADNIFVGDGVVAAGRSGIASNVPAGRVVMGYPATKMDTQVEMYKAMRRLPRLLQTVAALQKAVFKSDGKD